MGGIAGSLVFRGQDAPSYRPGIYACIACALLNIVLVCCLSLSFWVAHRRADKGKILEEDVSLRCVPFLRCCLLCEIC